jgi:hypothetical protein
MLLAPGQTVNDVALATRHTDIQIKRRCRDLMETYCTPICYGEPGAIKAFFHILLDSKFQSLREDSAAVFIYCQSVISTT